jgi:hypothetical protein
MHGIYELKEKLCDELEEYGEKGDLDVGTLDVVDKLSRTVKNLGKIIEKMEESEYSGESWDGMNTGRYTGRRYSGARRRDSMGRYSRRGYSMDNAEIVQDLRELMNEAPDERTRQEFQSFISKIERM